MFPGKQLYVLFLQSKKILTNPARNYRLAVQMMGRLLQRMFRGLIQAIAATTDILSGLWMELPMKIRWQLPLKHQNPKRFLGAG